MRAPASLLLDAGLPWTARLIWLLLRLHGPDPVGPAVLQADSGLSRPTVLAGLAGLAAAGWCRAAGGPWAACTGPRPAAGPDPRAVLPEHLLTDQRLGARARVLYGILQLTPGFSYPAGQFTYAGLAGLVHSSLPALRRAVGDLAQTDWIRLTQRHQLAPICFAMDNPVATRSRAGALQVKSRVNQASHRGEALMREYLSLLVDSAHFEDNAAPGFLVNPYTGERMQFDRYYPPSVAFEYNGPQHYDETDLYSAQSAARQRGRDYMKLGICVTQGITLVVVHAWDLSLNGMRQKIGSLLPLRDLRSDGPLIAYLEARSHRYRQNAHAGR